MNEKGPTPTERAREVDKTMGKMMSNAACQILYSVADCGLQYNVSQKTSLNAQKIQSQSYRVTAHSDAASML